MTLRDRVLARIREERERCEKATPGEWVIGIDYAGNRVINEGAALGYRPPWDSSQCVAVCPPFTVPGNSAFIASARTLLPALLSEALRQVEEHRPSTNAELIAEYGPFCNGDHGDVEDPDCPVILGWAKALALSVEE